MNANYYFSSKMVNTYYVKLLMFCDALESTLHNHRYLKVRITRQLRPVLLLQNQELGNILWVQKCMFSNTILLIVLCYNCVIYQ